MNMDKPHILLIYGGKSSEHEVSVRSATHIFRSLNPAKYDISICYIDRDGAWWLVDTVMDRPQSNIKLLPSFGMRAFVTPDSSTVLKPDVAFPVLHGKNGEDGTVQGVLELLDLPYAGPSLLGAAVTMDKDMTKRLVQKAGISVVPWRLLQRGETLPTYLELAEEFGETLFIKPSRAGSSVGVSKVTGQADLESAIAEAFKHDSQVLVEKAIDGREIELAVLGNHQPIASGPGEILPGDDFYSYDDKYADDSPSQTTTSPDLTPEMAAELQQLAITAYQATAGRGMARVDFLVDKHTGVIYLNEINAIPGFTSISMYPKLWQAAGLSAEELTDQLIAFAQE